MNNRITYIKKIPLAKSIFGVALFLVALMLLGFGYFIIGLFGCSLALGMLTTQGAQLDLTGKQY